MTLNELAKAAGENAIAKGFRSASTPITVRRELIPQRCALIHSEVSELLEHARNGEKPDDKMAYNKTRPYKHGRTL
jgi:hypothetical protein